MFAIRLCWFKALVPFNTAARFRFSRSPGSTNATIFGKTTGLLGRNRNFAKWSKIHVSLGQMPFSLFFHCIYGNYYLIIRIGFQRGFETFSSNFQLFQRCVFGGLDNEETDLAIGRTTWKESVYDKEAERN
jgi:hypothetical protein